MGFPTGRKWRLVEMRPRHINQSRYFYRLKTQVVKRIGLQMKYAHVGRQVKYRTVCQFVTEDLTDTHMTTRIDTMALTFCQAAPQVTIKMNIKEGLK